MRRDMDGLAALVQTALTESPFSEHVFLFRGRRGDLTKVLRYPTGEVRLTSPAEMDS